MCCTAAGAFARSRWSDGCFTGVADYHACTRGEVREGGWRVGDRGREGNDRVIEGEGMGINYKLLSVPPVYWITSQWMIVSSPSL